MMTIDQEIRRAAATLELPVNACVHLALGDETLLVMCVHHPEAGIKCRACMADHIERHGRSNACDICGQVENIVAGRTIDATVPLLTLTHARLEGGVIMPNATVTLTNIVSCFECATAYEVAAS